MLFGGGLAEITSVPGANRAQPETVQQLAHRLPTESLGVLWRTHTFLVEYFSDLPSGESFGRELTEPLTKPRVVAQVLQLAHRSDHDSLGLRASNPVDLDV